MEVQEGKICIPLIDFVKKVIKPYKHKERKIINSLKEIIESRKALFVKNTDYMMVDSEIFLTWNTVIKLLFRVESQSGIKIHKDVVNRTLDYLLSVQETYEKKIVPMISNHYEDMLTKMLEKVSYAEDHIKKKANDKADKKIKEQNQKRKQSESNLNDMEVNQKRLVTSMISFFRKPTDKKKGFLQDFLQTFKNNQKKEIKLLFEINQPLWSGLQCDIKFTNNCEDYIIKEDLKAYIERIKLPTSVKQQLYSDLTCGQGINKVKYISKIKWDFADENDELISEDESEGSQDGSEPEETEYASDRNLNELTEAMEI